MGLLASLRTERTLLGTWNTERPTHTGRYRPYPLETVFLEKEGPLCLKPCSFNFSFECDQTHQKAPAPLLERLSKGFQSNVPKGLVCTEVLDGCHSREGQPVFQTAFEKKCGPRTLLPKRILQKGGRQEPTISLKAPGFAQLGTIDRPLNRKTSQV